MEPELDLTLKLGLPGTDQTRKINSHQETKIGSTQQKNDGGAGGGNIFDHRRRFLGGGGEISGDEGAKSNMNANLMFSNYIFKRFSGTGNNTPGCLHFPANPAPLPSPAPINRNDFVIPARRAQRIPLTATAMHRNANANAIVIANANANTNANVNAIANARWKRCRNINCNTDEPPMWRSGPYGPQTLCNACGIKFRAEMEIKFRAEMEKRAQNNN